MHLKPAIHPLAKQHLRELQERWGITPTIDETLWIVQCCERVINPLEGERIDLCGVPVRVGVSQEYLWPFTIGSSIWWQDKAMKWFAGNDDMLLYAICFALRHGRDREMMRRVLRSKQEAEAAIHDWLGTLTCTIEELEAAVNVALPPLAPRAASQRPEQGNHTPIDYDRVVGEIEAATGIVMDYWVWDVSRDHTMQAWIRSRAVIFAMSGISPPRTEPLDDAIRDLAMAKTAIIQAHKKTEEPT